MQTKLFDYHLPIERIAQQPLTERDRSKLLLCYSQGRLGRFEKPFSFSHKVFNQIIDELNENDCLVFNNTKVLPVRLFGIRAETTGGVEALLLRKKEKNIWAALLHLSAHVQPGLKIIFESGLVATVISTHEERIRTGGEVLLEFSGIALNRMSLETWLTCHGHVPLPPYITRKDEPEDFKNYQTVFAEMLGSAAAPTAGFHFSKNLLEKIQNKGVCILFLTLDIGLATFRPIKTEKIEDHQMHEEKVTITPEFVKQFQEIRKSSKRIVAVGTTVVRALESWANQCESQGVTPGALDSAMDFSTGLFIKPDCHLQDSRLQGFQFQIVDDLITNFHLPKSTLLVLVAAAMGRVGEVMAAYKYALSRQYRFLSYGDAMFIRGLE